MDIPLFYKRQTNTAIGLVFNWAFAYKITQKHINNAIEMFKTFKSHIKIIGFTLLHLKEIR